MTTGGRRFFFCHLQKTAGTRLARRIRQNFDERAVFPHASDGDPIARVISVDHLLSVWERRRAEIRVVTGHFPLCTKDLLGAEFETFTVLRHPLDRTISYLRHHRRLTPADAHLTLEEVYDDDFRFNGLVHNHMTKMLSLLPGEMTDGALTRVAFDAERLERAKERLAGVDVVGLQEDFDGFCAQLTARFGWTFDDPVPRRATGHEDLPAAFRDRILADNAHDLELYDFATRLVDARRRVTA